MEEKTEPIDLAVINPELAKEIDTFLADPSTGIRRERLVRRTESPEGVGR